MKRGLGQLRQLERIVLDAVSGMDAEDTIGGVSVHFSDGTTASLDELVGEMVRQRRALEDRRQERAWADDRRQYSRRKVRR